MEQTHVTSEYFVGAQARCDIVDPRSGEVITGAGEIVTQQAAEWMAYVVRIGVQDLGELQDALVPAVAVGQ